MAKVNASPVKVAMPVQDPLIRNSNFSEVATGYTEEMALEEARRCLHCKAKPCVAGCPVEVKIPEFIALISEQNYEAAFQKIMETNSLPAVCGRVCPQETQCEARCVRAKKGEAVAIGRLERFVADWHRQNVSSKPERPRSNGHRVAVVGSGPAGLTCAADLAKMGYEVTIFEALQTGGGVLVYGIPEFRLPQLIVQQEIDHLLDLGVKLQTDMVIGRILTVDELLEDLLYEAVFIGSGAGLPSFLNIEGENLVGVYSANEYLTRVNLMKAYDQAYDTPIRNSRSVVVVGGGNVAMDAARTAKRLGAEEVHIVYRRSFEEMPARREEVEHAREEEVIFNNLTNPVRIVGDEYGEVTGIEVVDMKLESQDATGRPRPVAIRGSLHRIDCDTVIIAVGTTPNPLIKNSTEGLNTDNWGCIVTKDNGATSRHGVYAGGDAVTGAATVIQAMGAGKIAAESIDTFIKSKALT